MKKIILIGIMLLGANEETYGQLSRNPVNAKYIGQDFCVVDSTISTWYEYGNKPSGTWTYKAIYLDRKKLKYYSVTNIVKTNDIYYTYDAKKQEEVFRPDIRKYEKKLLYVGNISDLERVYIDTNDNKQYVKRLIPIKDEYTRFLDEILPVKGKFYPVMDETYGIIFTNKNYPGRMFFRSYTAEEGEYDESYGPGMLLNMATDEELSKYHAQKYREECGEECREINNR